MATQKLGAIFEVATYVQGTTVEWCHGTRPCGEQSILAALGGETRRRPLAVW